MSILELGSWKAVPLEENIEALQPDRRPWRRASKWRSTASPLDIYCYLKARFGPPNGFMMISVPPSSDNVFHWHYTLRAQTEELHIQGVGSRVEFLAFGNRSIRGSEWSELLDGMKSDFKKYGPGMADVRKSLERWALFVNPYFRLERVVAGFHARLVDLDLPSHLPEFPDDPHKFEAFRRKVLAIGQQYTEAAEVGLSLRMITPIWAESFVNLLIFVLAKPEVRSSDRVYADLLRKEIDVRIASLHLYCDGFREAVDRNVEEVRDFLRVMSSRNEVLHGNIDPKRLYIGDVYFEGKMPLFTQYQTMTERAFAPRLRHVEPDSVIRDIYRVEAFVDYVLRRLAPEVRRSTKMLMENEIPGWRSETGRPGILFSDVLVDYSAPLPKRRRKKASE